DGVIETNGVNVEWVAGRPNDVNYALDFDGGRVLVQDSQELRPLHQVSAAAWVKYSEAQSSSRVVAKGKNDKETYSLEVGGDDDLVFLVRDGNDPNAADYEGYNAESDKGTVDRDEWVHVAGTYDGNSVKAYINGELVAENNEANSIPFLSQDTNDLAIGNKPEATDNPFKGIIDDVRIYDRALTAAEIGYLASDGTGIVVETSIANLIDDGEAPGERSVNFRDFAILADEWLKREFWP
ncbi:MAG: LamG domain-containing protein, partial [Planctomycetota bacterium]